MPIMFTFCLHSPFFIWSLDGALGKGMGYSTPILNFQYLDTHASAINCKIRYGIYKDERCVLTRPRRTWGSFLTSTNLTIFGEFRWIQVNSAEKSDWIHLNSVGRKTVNWIQLRNFQSEFRWNFLNSPEFSGRYWAGRSVERNHHWIHLNSPKFIWIRSPLRMTLGKTVPLGLTDPGTELIGC